MGSFKQYSFRQLSRYLSLDFLKIFNISMSLYAFSNNMLENAEVSVTICVDCCDTVNKFSVFYDELERIQVELSECVRQVHGIMVNADRNPNVVQRYRQRMIGGSPAQLIEASIAEKMREETIQKCFRMSVGPNFAVGKGAKNGKNSSYGKQMRPASTSQASAIGATYRQNQCGIQGNAFNPLLSCQQPVQVKKDPDEEAVIDLSSDEESSEPIQIKSLVDRNGQIYSASGENLTQRHIPPVSLLHSSSNNYSSNSFLDPATNAAINEFIFPTSSGSTSLNRPFSSSSLFSKPKVQFKCETCEKITHSRHALELHKRQRHTGERPYRCIHCDRKFVSSGNLKIHIVQEHRELLFSQFKDSNTSDQDFKAAVDQLFENYKRSEDRTRPYLCIHCDIQGYLHKRDLQAHMFQYHFDLLASKLQNFQRASNQQRWTPPQQLFEMPTSGFIWTAGRGSEPSVRE